MRVVTTHYFAVRRHNEKSLLPWHFWNEMTNYGYLDLQPVYSRRRFRISRWLGRDDDAFYDDVKPLRYSERDEFTFASWGPRMYPFERRRELIAKMPEFHSEKENLKYVSAKLDDIVYTAMKRDVIEVCTPPYGGQPLVCIVKSGKVTIL